MEATGAGGNSAVEKTDTGMRRDRPNWAGHYSSNYATNMTRAVVRCKPAIVPQFYDSGFDRRQPTTMPCITSAKPPGTRYHAGGAPQRRPSIAVAAQRHDRIAACEVRICSGSRSRPCLIPQSITLAGTCHHFISTPSSNPAVVTMHTSCHSAGVAVVATNT
jgi:hypothetical protein